MFDHFLKFIDDKKTNIELLFYKEKIKKLDITPELMKTLLSKEYRNDFKKIISTINSCNTKEEFNQKLITMLKWGSSYAPLVMIGGILTKKFDIGLFSSVISLDKHDNVSNLLNVNDEVIKVLRNNFINYLNNDISKRNIFLTDKFDRLDYTLEFDAEKVLQAFDNFLNSIKQNVNYDEIIKNYIYNLCVNYSNDLLINNIDFVLYDINHKNDKLSLEERKINYDKYYGLTDDQINKIKNIKDLIEKLCSIKSIDTSNLVYKLYNIIDNPKDRIDELEDIYLEYEYILREDIVSSLYIPKNNIDIVENYQDMHTQLLHLFIRDISFFKENVKQEIKEDIINNRNNNDKSKELTLSENNLMERRLQAIDAMFDLTQVNYSFYTKNSKYYDRFGYQSYHSDTSNQISCSIYSDKYFFFDGKEGMIGIGFNKESIKPEAIVLSSKTYITTNKSLNNLEYNPKYYFEYESSCLNDLLKCDGKTELVLFRRGIDFDTKAAYVFCTIDSASGRTNHAYEQAIDYAKKNHMKLVVYDLYKIRKSYNEWIENSVKILKNNEKYKK